MGCVCIYKEICFKKLAHAIVGAGKSKMCRPREELMLQLEPEDIWRQPSFLFRGPQSFLLRPSSD